MSALPRPRPKPLSGFVVGYRIGRRLRLYRVEARHYKHALGQVITSMNRWEHAQRSSPFLICIPGGRP